MEDGMKIQNTTLTFKSKKQLDYRKVPGGYQVRYPNGVYMGDISILDDGYYAWWPLGGREGYIDTWVLRELADTVDELNEEWDNIVQNDPTISQHSQESS
jgi:hypothetical protein